MIVLALTLAVLAGSGDPASVDADQIVTPQASAGAPPQLPPTLTSAAPDACHDCAPPRPRPHATADTHTQPTPAPVDPNSGASDLVVSIVGGGTGTVVVIPPK
jgi:hypothetical protein